VLNALNSSVCLQAYILPYTSEALHASEPYGPLTLFRLSRFPGTL
jgi:hypothetical protein